MPVVPGLRNLDFEGGCNSYNKIKLSAKAELSCIMCSHKSEEAAPDLNNGGRKWGCVEHFLICLLLVEA